MSSYEGWLKITWLLNVTFTGICNCMYTQLDVHIFMWIVCVCVCLWPETCGSIILFSQMDQISSYLFRSLSTARLFRHCRLLAQHWELLFECWYWIVVENSCNFSSWRAQIEFMSHILIWRKILWLCWFNNKVVLLTPADLSQERRIFDIFIQNLFSTWMLWLFPAIFRGMHVDK